MNSKIWERLDSHCIHRNGWESVGEDGFYERERRTRVITKRKEIKGYAEIKDDLSIKEHKNTKYGVYGKKEYKANCKNNTENSGSFKISTWYNIQRTRGYTSLFKPKGV